MLEHSEPIVRWKVRYEPRSEPFEVLLPHAWRQDMPADYEGPVTYETTIKVPRASSTLLFRGVSYAAHVAIDGQTVLIHRGSWDAFALPLDAHRGRTIAVRVEVVKAGGGRHPLEVTASGGLPHLFQSFGGIYAPVELILGRVDLEPAAPPCRVRVSDNQIYLDGTPYYVRGIRHAGWYPELGHAHPPDATIREEVLGVRARGFNLVKFAQWVPPHRYLEILREEGMTAWLELPMRAPLARPDIRTQLAEEIERIVRQYRKHDNIVAWTIGRELGDRTPFAYRAQLVRRVKALTGAQLVDDQSAGGPMGDDPRECGSFHDLAPCAEPADLPALLDAQLRGPREELPVLLGECADADVHRDIARIGDEMPFWASALGELNPRGVRARHDLPRVVAESRFANHPTRSGHAGLIEASRTQASFVRKTAIEEIRSRGAAAGYVVEGLRDTPVSSTGVFDDWGEGRLSPEECRRWNGDEILFIASVLRASHVPIAWTDPLNRFAGPALWRIGGASSGGKRAALVWTLFDADGERLAGGGEEAVELMPGTPRIVGEIFVELGPGAYRLEVEFGTARNMWPIWVVAPPGGEELRVAASIEEEADVVCLAGKGAGVIPAPFWRGAAYEFLNDEFWTSVPFAGRWARVFAIAGDSVLDAAWLRDRLGEYEVLLNRVDTQSYADAPVLVRSPRGFITTLRPQGSGAGTPRENPAGWEFLRRLRAVRESG